MRKYAVWKCDICGQEKQSDGYPKDWIQVEIRRGDYFHEGEEQEVDKDCCSQACASKAVLDYYSEHRLDE